MRESEFQPTPSSALPAVLAYCPHCDAELAVLSVIAGRTGSEYWAMQCTECGGIHLDIAKPAPLPPTA
jgi:uncharacterized Zn finger protein